MDAESENSLTVRESDLYPWVRKFIKNKFKCFNKKLGEVGKEGIGYVDVFGVYYKDSKNTEIETVGVEVKPKKRRIAAEFGQAKGYSVFCQKGKDLLTSKNFYCNACAKRLLQIE